MTVIFKHEHKEYYIFINYQYNDNDNDNQITINLSINNNISIIPVNTEYFTLNEFNKQTFLLDLTTFGDANEIPIKM
jgi:hypothetical protein